MAMRMTFGIQIRKVSIFVENYVIQIITIIMVTTHLLFLMLETQNEHIDTVFLIMVQDWLADVGHDIMAAQ